MKKLFFLAAAMLASFSLWAATETTANAGTADAAVVGTSFTIPGNYVAGKGGKQVTPMPNAGVKIRLDASNKGGEAKSLVINVNEDYKITALTFTGVTNSDGKAATLGDILVDNVAWNGAYSKDLPAKDASAAANIAITGIEAEQSIVIKFADLGGATQANICLEVTYNITATPHKVTYKANYEGQNDSIEAEALKVNDNVFKNPAGQYFIGWNDQADGKGNNVAIGAKVTKDTVLYAQWKELKECLRLTVAAQGPAPAKDVEVALRLGSNAGGKIYFADAKSTDYTADYQYKPTGLQLGGGSKDSLRVVLDDALAAGAIVCVNLVAVNDGKQAINIVAGGKKINLITNVDYLKGDTAELYYTIVAADGLAGVKVFNLQREGSVILRSLSAQLAEDCKPVAAPFSEDTSLKSIKINGTDAKSSEGVYVDTLAADYSAAKVEVTYELNDANAKAEPAGGKFELDTPAAEATTEGKLTVTAQDGTIKEYAIAIYKPKAVEPDPDPDPDPDPEDQAIDNVETGSIVVKTFVNGQLIIIKNGIKYDVTGAIVK